LSARFDQVPSDPDTEVRKKREVEVDGYPALHQQWDWQGISGESLIFADPDVNGLSNTALKKLVASSKFVKGQGPVMLNRTDEGYIFVNFNYGA